MNFIPSSLAILDNSILAPRPKSLNFIQRTPLFLSFMTPKKILGFNYHILFTVSLQLSF